VQWLLPVGQGDRHGLSGAPVLPLGVVTPLTFHALPIIRAGLRGGGRDDGLGRQDQPIWLMFVWLQKEQGNARIKLTLRPPGTFFGATIKEPQLLRLSLYCAQREKRSSPRSAQWRWVRHDCNDHLGRSEDIVAMVFTTAVVMVVGSIGRTKSPRHPRK
jgi:hypothetical protein